MKVSELVLCRDHYKSQEEFENEIKKAVTLLLNSEHIMTIRYDEDLYNEMKDFLSKSNDKYGTDI